MVRSYLKYELASSFGTVTNGSANVVWSPHPGEQRSTGSVGTAVVGANEDVLCWDLQTGEEQFRLRDPLSTAVVSAISNSSTEADVFAVGYSDGTVRLWDRQTATLIVRFNGHRSAVTRLSFSPDGSRLASGSQDTNIIIWDLVAEVGVCKLRGHRGEVTGLSFLFIDQAEGEENGDMVDDADCERESGHVQSSMLLLSVSKDGLLKLWDVQSQQCIETHVAHGKGECWSLGLMPDLCGAVTGGADGDLKVWLINQRALRRLVGQADQPSDTAYIIDKGEFTRHGRSRITGVHFHPSRSYLALHGADKAVEIWRIRSEAEIKRSMARKQKRRREKLDGDFDHDPAESAPETREAAITDVFVHHVIVRTGGKVGAVDWIRGKGQKQLQLVLSASNNSIESYAIALHTNDSVKGQEPEYNRNHVVSLPGHRTDVRSMALSHDEQLLATVSNGSLKVWNTTTLQCIRTLDCGYGLCSAFLPGDRIVLVGTKDGELQLVDIASSTITESFKAHDREIWTLNVHPDGKSMVSGAADKLVKFWNFEIVQEEIPGTRRTRPKLKLVPQRNLKLGDDVLCARFSPDARLLAVSMLDSTIKVFFADSLKLYLNLYGHKLPVLNFDIAQDSKILVSCSADKNVRIWGLDFGDCHKALFGHLDSVMCVSFIPNLDAGHLFFSASKDRAVKYWDGDKFEQVQKLPGGPQGEIWAMAVSRKGEFVATASHDKSIRVWRQTEEQIFLEEERERELEELYEGNMEANLAKDEFDADEQGQGTSTEIGVVTRQTMESLKAGERVMEAMDVCAEDIRQLEEYDRQRATTPELARPGRDPIFLANQMSAETNFHSIISKIPAATLTDALLVLPFSKIPPLFKILGRMAEQEMDLPLTCRVLFFMLQTHHKQIVATRNIRVLLDRLRDELRRGLQRQKDEMGVSVAGLGFLERSLREREGGGGFVDGLEDRDGEKDVRKRGFMSVS